MPKPDPSCDSIDSILCEVNRATDEARAAVASAKQSAGALKSVQDSLLRVKRDANDAMAFAQRLVDVAIARESQLRESLAELLPNDATDPELLEKARAWKLPAALRQFARQFPQTNEYYDRQLIDVRAVRRPSASEVAIDFATLIDTQRYCSGFDLSVFGDRVVIRAVRQHIMDSPSAMVPATSPSGLQFLQTAILPVAAGIPLFLADTSGESSLGSSGTPPAERPRDIMRGDPTEGIAPVSGGTITVTPPALAPPPPCPFILCIHSNAAESDGAGYLDGHAWLTLSDGATGALISSYGLWPDGHPGITADGLANGDGSDVRVNYPGDFGRGKYRFCVCISNAMKAKLDAAVAQNITWTYTNTCASFASDVFFETTGLDIDADDFGGFETPRELGDSIKAANGGTAAPSTPPAPPAPGSSSSLP